MNDKLTDDVNVLARETAEQMIFRLSLVAMQPVRILAIGDFAETLLKERYPSAEMIHSTHVPDHSIDLVFANLVLPWCQDKEMVLREWQRVLRKEGLLMMTSFGPDTLWEVHERDALLPSCVDMHNIGDELAQTGFADPVLDVEYFTLTYREHQQLLHELYLTHMIASEQAALTIEKNKEGILALTYEVIYGHAWGTGRQLGYNADEMGTVKIPLAALRRRL